MIGPVSDSAGFDTILVIKDYLTKAVILVPTNVELTSEGAAEILLEKVYAYYGLPEKVVSDRGGQFVSKFLREVYRKLGVKTAPSTAYHPQTDGLVERANQEVEVVLRALIREDQSDWAAALPLAQFALNSRSIRDSDITPFMALHGYEPIPIPGFPVGSNVPAADDFLTTLSATRERLREVLSRGQGTDVATFDSHSREPEVYGKDQLVYLDSRNLPLHVPSRKLGPKFVGPFPVSEKVGTSAYRLVLPSSWRIHPVFNESLLKPFRGDPATIRPPPELIEGGEEYDVEKVLAKRKRRGKVQYLVSWVGYPPEENTWEPLENLPRAKEAIAEFVQEHES